MSVRTLTYASNEILARHGYCFVPGGEYDVYFRSQPWYEPIEGRNTREVLSSLSDIEWYNYDLIMRTRDAVQAAATPTPTPTPTPRPTATPTPRPTQVGPDYIFPHSSSRKLTREEVSEWNFESLAYAYYEIYARHGLNFDEGTAYADYFNSRDWYKPNADSDLDLVYDAMSETETYNADLIKQVRSIKKLNRSSGRSVWQAGNGIAPNAAYAFDPNKTFRVEGQSKGNPFTLSISLDKTGRIDFIYINTASLTEGKGKKCGGDETNKFPKQFFGKAGPFEVGGNIDAVSGATITSGDIVDLINETIRKIKSGELR